MRTSTTGASTVDPDGASEPPRRARDSSRRGKLARRMVAGLCAVLAGIVVVLALALIVPGPSPQRLPCPRGEAHCRSAAGRALHVWRDPRGDHVVLVSRDAVSFPLVSVLKFHAGQGPRDIHLGTWVAARGPVHVGSHGEDVILVSQYNTP